MKWTPVTERLPNKQGEYLVTTSADDEYKYVEIQYFNKCKFYNANDEWGDMYDEGVTAWAPLPEPYEAEQTEPQTERSK